MYKALRGERKQDALLDGGKFCNVAAAVIGSAVIGGVVASSSASKVAGAAERTSQENIASSERIQQQQLDQSKREFDAAQLRNAKIDGLTERVTNSQIASQDKANNLADEYAAYNRETFRPLEQGIVDEAKNYDSTDAQAKAAGQASTDLASATTAKRDAVTRNMARMGVNPTDGRFMAAMGDPANDALGDVTARNNARDKIKVMGAAKRMDAASLGRGLPSAQATSAGLALTAGNSAVGNQVAANGSMTSSSAPAISLLGGASQTGGIIGQNAAALYGAATKSANDTQGGIGSAAGMLLNYYK